QQSVVRRSISVYADGVECSSRHVAQRLLQKRGRNRRIGGDKRQHRRHIGMNHPRALGAAYEMNALSGHLERSSRGFRASVRGANGERSLRKGTRRRAAEPSNDRQRAQNFRQRKRKSDRASGATTQFMSV